MTASNNTSVLQSRTLALLVRGWIAKHNRPPVKFSYLLELVRSLRYLVQRANIMTCADDLTAMIFINAERFIESFGSIDHTLHAILFTSFGITAKFWEDDRLFNTHIAQACGMNLEQLNKMECLFLTHLKFEVLLTPAQVADFYADARKRWEGRSSVTVPHAPFLSASVSRLVASFLHSKEHSSSLSSKPTATRTLSTPALFSPSTTSASPSPPSPAPVPSRTASRTVSTPSFSTTSPIITIFKPTAIPKAVSSKDITTKPRLEKASTRLLNFFRSRDE